MIKTQHPKKAWITTWTMKGTPNPLKKQEEKLDDEQNGPLWC